MYPEKNSFEKKGLPSYMIFFQPFKHHLIRFNTIFSLLVFLYYEKFDKKKGYLQNSFAK